VIAAIVLAAGGSSRLSQPKQLLRFEGESLVRRAARAALDADCTPVVVVVGQQREPVVAALHDLSVTLVPNDFWEGGIGTSIRAGVRSLSDSDALIILTCDQPHVDATLIRQLVARHEETQKPMVASAYAGTFGVPALFGRSCFEQLLSLGDEQGAKVLLTARPNDVAQVDFPEGAIDVDTPEDWARLGSAEL
jgi:molybdenum cofactor cytidylyltransferase